MSIKGSVYRNSKFTFHDGLQGNKLLVLLNTPTENEDYLFVKTTSQRECRITMPGCGTYYDQGEYFIPKGSDCFLFNTWIVLYEIYQIPLNDIEEKPDWSLLRDPTKKIDDIIECLFEHHSDDIMEQHEELIRPSMPSEGLLERLKKELEEKNA